MFDAATIRAIGTIAARLKVQPAALQAVAEIESAGKVFAVVDGRICGLSLRSCRASSGGTSC